MSTRRIIVCDQCGGQIPSGADSIQSLMGSVLKAGQVVNFAGVPLTAATSTTLDFCSTSHMAQWLQANAVKIPVPNPPYSPPPASLFKPQQVEDDPDAPLFPLPDMDPDLTEGESLKESDST